MHKKTEDHHGEGIFKHFIGKSSKSQAQIKRDKGHLKYFNILKFSNAVLYCFLGVIWTQRDSRQRNLFLDTDSDFGL